MNDEKKPPEDWDDGRTVAPMDGVDRTSLRGLFGGKKKKKEEREKLNLTKKEKRSASRAMMSMLLPRFLIILLGFGVAAGVVILWFLL